MNPNTQGAYKPPTKATPEPVDWSALIAYQCNSCYSDCINHRADPWAIGRECLRCWNVPDLADPAVDRGAIAVELVTDGGSTTARAAEQRSEDTSERERPEAGACPPTRKPQRKPPTGGRGLSYVDGSRGNR